MIYTSACCLTDQPAPTHSHCKMIIMNLDCLDSCDPNKHHKASKHREAEKRVRGSSSPDNPIKQRDIILYLFTVKASAVQWSNTSPTKGLLCGDAIITTTLPLSIYSSQGSVDLSLCLLQSLCQILHTECQMH